MTRPTLPGLVAEWTRKASRCDEVDRYWCQGDYATLKNCAAELSQAVALTDEEVEALRYADAERAEAEGCVFVNVNDYDTLRALVTRLTAASDGGGKGENHE